MSQPRVSEKAIRQWRSISSFADYSVSDDGLVMRTVPSSNGIPAGTILKPDVGHKGHLRVTLQHNGRKARRLVHRLVLQHFGGAPPTTEHECAHGNGNPSDNRVENLRWATKAENAADRAIHGTDSRGSKCPFAVLTEEQVVAIRKASADGAPSREIAERFGRSLTAVNKVIIGQTWAYVGGPTRTKQSKSVVDDQRCQEAIESVRAGMSANAASKKYGVSRQTIRRRQLPPQPSEKKIHAAVVKHWETFGAPDTLVATLANEYAHGQPGLTPGLFDLMVLGPGIGVGFIELKTSVGIVSPAQNRFRSILEANGIPHAICRGRDEPIRVLEQWGVVRRAAA